MRVAVLHLTTKFSVKVLTYVVDGVRQASAHVLLDMSVCLIKLLACI